MAIYCIAHIGGWHVWQAYEAILHIWRVVLQLVRRECDAAVQFLRIENLLIFAGFVVGRNPFRNSVQTNDTINELGMRGVFNVT